MIKINELFSGIGAFRKALIRLNIPHKIVGISEIDKYAIASYNAIYGETRNYGDISKISKLDYADLWTYGFPCQDLSNAGKQQGMIKGQTRSGLLYEVQRLLGMAALYDELPKYLIMENVKPLVGKKFLPKFTEWTQWLDGCGYNTYWQVMNAAQYGIPQKRERVIAVSIRKDIDEGFTFPAPIPLDVKFRDLLETDVEKKFYLSEETYEWYQNHNKECEEKGLGFRFSPVERESAEIAKTLTARPDRTEVNYIREV
jgi:DNA (cytosine-5)-methyltransferase 1